MIPLHFVLAVDPGTLLALGVGLSGLAGAGTAAASLFNTPKAPTAAAPPPPAQTPTGTSSTNKSGNQPSFLAAAAGAPQQQSLGNKSLLGQ